ncbi:amidohydrolase [Streptosporangium roseum]|uniref:amidohydrolase n=1 Tax=Streptosporangium roseum TaxID=2001 RepID=UPI0009DFF87D|nr:amidohydrolase [Streptosporangium roseum]
MTHEDRTHHGIQAAGDDKDNRPSTEFPAEKPEDTPPGDADVIYYGGEIVTVSDAPSTPDEAAPEAVVVKDGLIVFVGGHEQAVADWQGEHTTLRDLEGRTLLPGFIDAHSHLTGIGLQATIASLLAEPDGDVTDIASLQAKLREFADSEVGRRSEWIVGFGYDDAMLAERRHPDRDDLDEVSTERPVLAIHQSFHLGAVNGKGLELLGYGRGTPDPDGGVIRRRSPLARPYGEPDGVLEETAFNPASAAAIAGLALQDLAQFLPRGMRAAASFGFTTVQEGAATLEVLGQMRKAAAATPGGLTLDVVAYVRADDAIAHPNEVQVSETYTNGLRAAGIKMFLDGSPQGRTAWLTKPYLTPPPGQEKGYCGYPTIEDDDLAAAQVRAGFEHGWQVIAHVNGDAAIDQLISAVRTATEEADPADRRTVAIHAQTARDDQIAAFGELGVLPSFFSMHTYYWGDWYLDTVLGSERAENISPAQWALARGMRYTSHHDAPVALPNSIAILASQITRVTRSGAVLGPRQRVSRMDAVRSITLNAAYQYFEEDSKGSIEVGKLADLVILSANPVTIAADEIRNIEVVETIKAGRTVHPAAEPKTDPGPTVSVGLAPHC